MAKGIMNVQESHDSKVPWDASDIKYTTATFWCMNVVKRGLLLPPVLLYSWAEWPSWEIKLCGRRAGKSVLVILVCTYEILSPFTFDMWKPRKVFLMEIYIISAWRGNQDLEIWNSNVHVTSLYVVCAIEKKCDRQCSRSWSVITPLMQKRLFSQSKPVPHDDHSLYRDLMDDA